MPKLYEVQVCADCQQAEANGLDSFEHSADFARRFTDNANTREGARLLLGHLHTEEDCGREVLDGSADCPFEEASFSWAACEWCGETLGGDRFPACVEYPSEGVDTESQTC